MLGTPNRPLRVFLCHSSNDKPLVRELYHKLYAERWIQPWIDEEELYPGQDWNLEIEKAVETADAILVCLSNNSITKEGYVQRELRIVLDYSDYKPEGTLYIIPVRLENCEPPRRLRSWQYADYFPEERREHAFQRLLISLRKRADSLGLQLETPHNTSSKESKPVLKSASHAVEEQPAVEKPKPVLASQPSSPTNAGQAFSLADDIDPSNKLTLSNEMAFVRVPAGKFLMGSTKENRAAFDNEHPQHTVELSYDYWIGRFPVTNEQYNVYIRAKRIQHPVDGWAKKTDHPVTHVGWTDAITCCNELSYLLTGELPTGLILRLPTEAEWEKAARGMSGNEYPWGNEFDKSKCNSYERGQGSTTPVGIYSPRGDSPFGCADMAGNVWEWTHSLNKAYPYQANDGREGEKGSGNRVRRGGAFDYDSWNARCAFRGGGTAFLPNILGFRVVAAPPISEVVKKWGR